MKLQLEFYEPLLEFLRPGEGDPGSNCGVSFFWRCTKCGHRMAVASRCLRRVCPNCGGTRWAWRQAKVVLQRMMAIKRKFLWPYDLRHVTVSFDDAQRKESGTFIGQLSDNNLSTTEIPPPTPAIPENETALRRGRKKVYSTLKAMGFVGGITAFHPWRKVCLGCHKPFEADHFCPSSLSGNFPGFEWVVSPHWHTIGIGRVDADKRPEGVVVKTIKRTRRGRRRSWTATIKYILDHAGVANDHHAYTWWGEFSYNKFPKAQLKRYRTFRLEQDTIRVCPFDGAEMVVHFPGFEFQMVVERFPWLNEPPERQCECPNCPRY